MFTESTAGRGTSKPPELCKVAQDFKLCHFTEMIYDQQANFHNLDASSAENTEWHDQKKPSKPKNKQKTHRYFPLLTVNESEILSQNL